MWWIAAAAVWAQEPAEPRAGPELEEVVAQLTVLQRSTADSAARAAAVEELGELGDARALPFLRAETARSTPDVQIALAVAARTWPEEEDALAITRWLLRPGRTPAVRSEALHTVEVMADDPQIVEILTGLLTDDSLEEAHVEQVRSTLTRRYPDVAQPTPEPKADPSAPVLMAYGTAIPGGSLLALVGALGRTDEGIVIGALGGGISGGAAGALYGYRTAATHEEALQYAGAVTWGSLAGLAAGELARLTLKPEPIEAAATAGLLAAGSTAGAIVALVDPREPSSGDQGEVHLAGGLGTGLGTGIGLIVEPDGDGTEPLAGAAAGGAAGLVVGRLAQDAWHLEGAHAPLGLTASGEGLWLGALLPLALDLDDEVGGGALVGLSAGSAAGWALADVLEVPDQRVVGNLYGFAAGNALGVAGALWSEPDENVDEEPLAQAALVGGAIGATAGTLLADSIPTDAADLGLEAATTALLAGNALAISAYLDQHEGFRHTGALTLTTTGAALPLSAVLAHALTPRGDQVLLGTAAAGWGGWHGGMVLIAVDQPGEYEDGVLVVALSADAFVAGSAVAMGLGLEPYRTVVPQLGAVGGATVGALATTLGTEEAPAIATGALIGSTVGFVAGSIIESRRPDEPLFRMAMGPGGARWTPSLAPMPTRDGVGVRVGLSVTGW